MRTFKFKLVHNSLNTKDDAGEALYAEDGSLITSSDKPIKRKVLECVKYANEHDPKGEHGFFAEIYMSDGEIKEFPKSFAELDITRLTKKIDIFNDQTSQKRRK